MDIEEKKVACEADDNGAVKEYYCFVGGVGAGRAVVACEVNRHNTVAVTIEKSKTGKINVSKKDNGAKIGWVIGENDHNFALLKSQEPMTNTVISDEELSDLMGARTVIEGTAVRVATVSTIEIRVELGEDTATTPVEETVTTGVVDNDSEKLLESFSEENKNAMMSRISYINTLEFTPKIRNNVVKHVIDFLKGRDSISVFEPCFVNTGSIVENAITNILAGSNLCLAGPKGTGKNKLVEHLTRFFDMSLCDMQMSYDTAKEEIRGEPTINDDGKVAVRLSNILIAASKPSIICLDEANMARGSITSLLHSATDHRRYVEVPGYGEVKIHPQARFIITINEGDEYEGTRNLNGAFRDRFHTIVFTPSADHIAKVFEKECNLSPESANELATMYKIFYNAVYGSDCQDFPEEALSQRQFVRAGIQYSMGFSESIHDAVYREVVSAISDAETRGIIEKYLEING